MAEHIDEANDAQNEGDGPRINNYSQKFLEDLNEERERLSNEFPLCALLIEEAIERIRTTGNVPGREFYADVYKQRPIKLVQKVFVPIKQYPKFNFTGKILGPKGNSLRRLQDETQCRIVIKGRNSKRDRVKEEELRTSGDPRHAHLNKDLFVEISTVATPAESYARIAYALAEIRKYIVPDKNDEVSQEQLRELMEIDPKSAKQYSKSIADNAPSKFLNFVKQYAYHMEQPREEESEEEVYETRVPKRTVVPATGYTKAKFAPSTPSYKRPQTAGIYGTEIKRLREAPIKPSNKSFTHGILKKYK